MLLELFIKHLLKSSPLVCSKFHLAVSYIGPLVFIFSWLVVRLGPLGNGTPLTCKPKPDDSLTIETLNGLAYSAQHWEYSSELQEDNAVLFEVNDKINFGYLRYVSKHSVLVKNVCAFMCLVPISISQKKIGQFFF